MSETGPVPTTMQKTVETNIEAILSMEQTYLRRRSRADKLADAIASFTGTLWFVLMHLVWFGLWAVVNTRVFAIRPFDPYPFQLLTMLVTIEAVLIATFVLIKQSRMGYMSDRRAHVDLQINLLTEREVTRLLRLSEEIARRLGIPGNQITGGLDRDTKIEKLVEALDQRLSSETGDESPPHP